MPGCPLSLWPILFLLKLPRRNPHPSPLILVPVQPSGITEASNPPHSPETVIRVLQGPLNQTSRWIFNAQCTQPSATSAPRKIPTPHLSEKIARDSQARRPSGPTPRRGSDAALSHPGAEVIPAQTALPNSRPNGNNVTWPLSGARRLEPAVVHLPCKSFLKAACRPALNPDSYKSTLTQMHFGDNVGNLVMNLVLDVKKFLLIT